MSDETKFRELQTLVIQWAGEKGILAQSDYYKQTLKTYEELGELMKAIFAGDRKQIKLELGDVIVTQIIARKLADWPALSAFVYSVRYDFVMKLSLERSCFELCDNVTDGRIFIERAWRIADEFGFTVTDALQSAYEKISKREGQMENGIWVKRSA